jgi:hypothetical protein
VALVTLAVIVCDAVKKGLGKEFDKLLPKPSKNSAVTFVH